MNDSVKTEIKKLIQNWLLASQNMEFEAFFSYFNQERVFLIGDGKNEIAYNIDQVRKLYKIPFAADKLINQKLEILDIDDISEVAIVSIIGQLEAHQSENKFSYPLRSSVVLWYNSNVWKIRHLHISSPLFGTDDEYGWPTAKKLENSILQIVKEFDLLLDLEDSKISQIHEYLTKARELAATLS